MTSGAPLQMKLFYESVFLIYASIVEAVILRSPNSEEKLGHLWFGLDLELEDEVDHGQGFIDYKGSLGYLPQMVMNSTLGNFGLSDILNIFHTASLL